MRYALAALAALTLLAPTARANWNVKVKATCFAQDGDKLVKEKGGNANIIGACLGVSPDDPAVDDFAVTFDSDVRELHVIRRCDSAVICDMSTQISCAVAGQDDKAGINTTGSCQYDIIDFGKNDLHGTFLCKEREKEDFAKEKFSFKATCNGNLTFNGQPCEFSFSTRKLFEESGSCPTSSP